MMNNRWTTEKIQTAYIEDRPTRLVGVRRLFHKIMPGIVHEPRDRKYIHSSDGRVRHITAIVASTEGVRYGGSRLAMPAQRTASEIGTEGFHDPLAVEIGLGVGAIDLPAEGWPDDFKPEVAELILRHFPEDE